MVDSTIGDLVITSQTVSSRPQRSDYSPPSLETEITVDSQTTSEIADFLNMFFALYPQASEQQLRFYDEYRMLPAINKNLIFSQLINPVIVMDKEGNVRAQISVEYLCQETKTTQISSLIYCWKEQIIIG